MRRINIYYILSEIYRKLFRKLEHQFPAWVVGNIDALYLKTSFYIKRFTNICEIDLKGFLPASLEVAGFAYTVFRGNPDSPGMLNFEIAKEYNSWVPWAFVAHLCRRFRHSVMYSVK